MLKKFITHSSRNIIRKKNLILYRYPDIHFNFSNTIMMVKIALIVHNKQKRKKKNINKKETSIKYTIYFQ